MRWWWNPAPFDAGPADARFEMVPKYGEARLTPS